MGKKGIVTIFIGVILAVLVGIIMYAVMLKRHKTPKNLEEITQQIHTLRELGFQEDAYAMQLLVAYQERLHEQVGTDTENRICDLSKLIALHRKMLTSYLKDIRDTKKIGFTLSSSYIADAYDAMARLTISLADMEKNTQPLLDEHEKYKKAHRMRDIAKKSAFNFTNECMVYAQHSKDAKACTEFIHEQVTDKIRTWQELELMVSMVQ